MSDAQPVAWLDPALYVAVILVGLLVNAGMRLAILSWASRAHHSPSPAGRAGTAMTPGGTLHVGDLPRGDDVYLLALLRNGRHHLARTLLAGAHAEGWLTDNGPLRDARPSTLAQRRFHEEMLRATSTRQDPSAEAAALRTATALLPGYRKLGETHGLLLAGPWKIVMTALPYVTCFGVVVWGAGRPHGDPTLMSILHGAGTLAFIGLALWTGLSDLTPAGRRYLAWLEESTTALVGDVESSARRDPEAVALAVAVGAILRTPPSSFRTPARV